MKPTHDTPTFKLAAHDLVDRLPSDATWDDLIEAIRNRQAAEAAKAAGPAPQNGTRSSTPTRPKHVAAAAQDCPVCKLVNPPTAQRCDCGYDFAAQEMRRTYLTNKDLAQAADDERARTPDLSTPGMMLALLRFFLGK